MWKKLLSTTILYSLMADWHPVLAQGSPGIILVHYLSDFSKIFNFLKKIILKSHCFLSVPSLFLTQTIGYRIFLQSAQQGSTGETCWAPAEINKRIFHNNRNPGMHLGACELDGGF